MTAYSTQGSKIEFAKQSVFGTASVGTYDDIKIEGTPSALTPVGDQVTPETLSINPNDVDKPIVFYKAKDNAFTVGTLIRQAATAGETSFIRDLFLSGGYVVVSEDNMVTTGTPVVGELEVDDSGDYAAGYAVNVELANGTWVPTLIADVTSKILTPCMDLPKLPATVGGALNACDCITPGDTGQITDTDLLTLKAYIKAQDGGNDVVIQGIDCVVTSMSDLTLNPGEKVVIEATMGSSELTATTGTLGVNDFRDGEEHRIFNEPWCQFAASNAAGGITAAYHRLMSATFSWGITAEQIAGFGDGGCVNNIQGWMQKNAPAKLTMTMLYDEQKLEDFDGTNPDKYVGIIQPGTSENSPAFALFLPNAHITSVSSEPWTNNEHRVTVEMTPQPAGLDGATGNTQGNQPWYFCVAADSTDA